jgi:hypothetical protein
MPHSCCLSGTKPTLDERIVDGTKKRSSHAVSVVLLLGASLLSRSSGSGIAASCSSRLTNAGFDRGRVLRVLTPPPCFQLLTRGCVRPCLFKGLPRFGLLIPGEFSKVRHRSRLRVLTHVGRTGTSWRCGERFRFHALPRSSSSICVWTPCKGFQSDPAGLDEIPLPLSPPIHVIGRTESGETFSTVGTVRSGPFLRLRMRICHRCFQARTHQSRPVCRVLGSSCSQCQWPGTRSTAAGQPSCLREYAAHHLPPSVPSPERESVSARPTAGASSMSLSPRCSSPSWPHPVWLELHHRSLVGQIDVNRVERAIQRSIVGRQASFARPLVKGAP